MAKTTTVTVTDDLDGSANAATVRFGYDGTNYEIDLGKRNAIALEKALKPYIQNARRNRGTGASSTRGRSKRADLTEVRNWARNNGYKVSDRGRIASHVVDAFEAAPH